MSALRRPATETHELAERKLKELERLREAWGIQEDAVEGAAFDQDLQVIIPLMCRLGMKPPSQELSTPVTSLECCGVSMQRQAARQSL